MRFDRLQKLGEHTFRRIVNELMRGTPAAMVARLIQQGWGDAHDVSEATLAKQLVRLHTAITNGAFGGELASEARRTVSVQIQLLHGSSFEALDHLITIALIQKERVHTLWLMERVTGRYMFALTREIKRYTAMLLSIQEIKFDLGLDEYKRCIPPHGR